MTRILITGASSTVDNHQPLIQRALDAVDAAGGGVVEIADGVHYLNTPLKIGSHTLLRMAPAVELIRNFSGLGESNATIQNKNLSAGNTTISISGGTIKALDSSKTGKHLALAKVAYVSLEGTRFLSVYGDWNTVFRDCTDVTVSNLVIQSDGSTEFQDGLHFLGGARIAVANCLISTGDDAIALTLVDVTPAAAIPIADVVITNCYLHSIRANALRIWINDVSETSIRRVRVSNIVAKTGNSAYEGAGVVIANNGGTGTFVTDVELSGFYLDASQSFTRAAYIYNCRQIRLDRYFVSKPMYRIEIDACNDIVLSDCVVDSPRGAYSQCVLVASAASCANIRIIGGRYLGARHHALQFGTASLFVNGFEVRGALIEGNEETTLNGIHAWYAAEGLVCNNTIKNCIHWGIYEDAALGNNNLFLGNRLFNNTLGPISFGGNNSQAIRNVAPNGVQIADSGGFRETIDGWSIATTATNDTEMDRWGVSPVGGRYRASRKGSITGLVIACPDAISGGTVTATVWKNTGTPGATSGASVVDTGYSITLSSGTKNASTQARNATLFADQDELFLRFTKTGTPTSTMLRCSFEVEI